MFVKYEIYFVNPGISAIDIIKMPQRSIGNI